MTDYERGYAAGVEDAAKVLTDNGYGDTRGLLLVRALAPAPSAAPRFCDAKEHTSACPPWCAGTPSSSAPASGGDEWRFACLRCGCKFSDGAGVPHHECPETGGYEAPATRGDHIADDWDGAPSALGGDEARCERCGGTGSVVMQGAEPFPERHLSCPACQGRGAK